MPNGIQLKKAKTAVLVMDYQNEILASYGKDSSQLLNKTEAILKHARQQGAHVIYVVIGFRPNYPEISERNPSFSALRQSNRFIIGTPGAAVHTQLTPQANDVTVVKHRVSAFAGSDLEMVLRAKGIETMVLMGISTSGVVLSTLRQSADMDFQVIVVKDCCADTDDEAHRVLTEKIFPRQATVINSEEFLQLPFTN